MIFDANGRAATNTAPPPLYSPWLAISHRRFPDTPPDIPRAEKLPELCNPPVMRASITYHIQPSGCGGGVHQLPPPPPLRHVRSPSPLPSPFSDASISSSLQLDTFPEGLYYAYSLERMLCKSGLENRFLIAARKKSGDFASAYFYLKRVADVLHVRPDKPRGDCKLFFFIIIIRILRGGIEKYEISK